MSSNLLIKRICKHCRKEFTAKTTTTKYCSHKCNSADYKKKKRLEKVEYSNKETIKIKTEPIERVKAKEFLTVKDVSILLGCSLRTAYRFVNNGTINAVNLAERMTRVKKSELNKLLEYSAPRPKLKEPEHIQFEISDCYTLTEIQNKYGVSEKALHDIIKRNNIPKIKRGWHTYVPIPVIDNLLT